MLHLLPQYQKEKVIREYRLRLSTVIVGAVCFLAAVYVIFTLPTFMLVQGQKNFLSTQKDSLSQIINMGGSSTQDNNLEVWKSVDALTPFAGTLHPLVNLDAVNSKLSGIKIDGYNFVQANPGEQITVGVTGTAKTREDLTQYVKQLNVDFGGVKLPLASLVKQSDIPFDFKFQVGYKKFHE